MGFANCQFVFSGIKHAAGGWGNRAGHERWLALAGEPCSLPPLSTRPYSPAIHVNQEGYLPNYSKKAMIGYYLGSLGEMNLSNLLSFTLVRAADGIPVYTNSLTARPDADFNPNYFPKPYQNVLEADFTAYTVPGEYQLEVPGMGASLPFLINEGIAMDFARTYALGLYHQRCGTSNALPFTRFAHDACHVLPANVPTAAPAFDFTWQTISNYSLGTTGTNQGPVLSGPDAQLFPFIKSGAIDVSGGHHDAGDYSKYTINVANLIHTLTISADVFPGVGQLDNLGNPGKRRWQKRCFAGSQMGSRFSFETAG